MKIEYWDEAKSTKMITRSDPRNLCFGLVNNCTLDGESLHYPNLLLRVGNQLILPTIEQFMSLGRGTIYEKSMFYKPKNDSCYTNVEDRPVFFFNYNVANYYHWLYDTIPYLVHYFELLKAHPDAHLLCNFPYGQNAHFDFFYDTLSCLGIPRNRVIFPKHGVLYQKMYLGSSLTHNRYSSDPPHPLAQSIYKRFKAKQSQPKRIYLSRRTWTKVDKNRNIGTDYTLSRKCVNEDNVFAIFDRFGFEEIFCEDYTIQEKVSIFRNAEIVAGPMGGGFANVLFSRPETTVLCINSPDFFRINERLYHSLQHASVQHFNSTKFLRKSPSQSSANSLSVTGGFNSPWEVDLVLLEQMLKNLIS